MPRGKRPGRMGRIASGTEPREIWSLDTVDMPLSERGNKKIISCIDNFSRFLVAVPAPDASAQSIANFLVERIIFVHGPPRALHSDLGSEFANHVVQEVARALGANHTFSTPLHPQANGIVERSHRTLLDSIAKEVAVSQKNWEVCLPAAIYSYNAAVHSSTKHSPFFLMAGADPRFDIEVALAQPPRFLRPAKPMRVFARGLVERIQQGLRTAREQSLASHERNRKRYDEDRPDCDINAGDLVWLHWPNARAREDQRRKLVRPWRGPYRVLERPFPQVARIQHLGQRQDVQVVAVQRLKHFVPRPGEDLVDGEIEVDSIEDERLAPDDPGVREFLMLPRDGPRRSGFWTREANLNAPELLAEWRRTHQALPVGPTTSAAQLIPQGLTTPPAAPRATTSPQAKAAPATSGPIAAPPLQPVGQSRSGRVIFANRRLAALSCAAAGGARVEAN
jgi:transposase InsO family protein